MATRPTDEELEEALTENLRQYRAQPRAELSVGRGWYPLLADLDRRLTELAGGAEFYAYHQIKDKFGGLRCYVGISTDLPEETLEQMRGAIRSTERRADQTCEECSRPGTYREFDWWRVICDGCEAEREAKRGALGSDG